MAGAGDYEKMDLFYLGRKLDPESGATTRQPLLYKNKHLTTHAAIIGMTGSGKTGLGIDIIEEAAIDKLPAIIIDPKGDMTNLLLSFPDLAPDDFAPWLDAGQVEQKGGREKLAEQTAADWEKGLGSWDQDKERIARMRANADFVVYTPGSSSGRPVSVLDSMEAPAPELLEDNETAASLVNSTVGSILALVGIKADPLKSREHILLSSIVLFYWRKQQDLSLEALIGAVVQPPFSKIGSLGTDVFFPRQKRMDLAMQLNNILASPAFSGWTKGEPLAIENFLYAKSGKPQVSIFSIAHLSDDERMFFVSMLLGRFISWMRQQEGSSGLRCLLYMDEIFGYFPPNANPPSKKPMLLLLKQARAYGVGVVLSTQNPVDLDYKGLSNIGTWFVGRLQTRQDQDRVMAGIAGSSDSFSERQIRDMLSGMRGRTFLLYSAHQDEPVLFETRWAMSYLKGPVSLSEIGRLTNDDSGGEDAAIPADSLAAPSAGSEYSATPPMLAPGIEQCYLPPPIPMEEIRYAPSLLAKATVRFVKQSQGIDETREVCLRLPATFEQDNFDWDRATEDTFDREDCTGSPGSGSRFAPLSNRFGALKNLRSLEKDFDDFLYHSMRVPLVKVASLKLLSKPGETPAQFNKRLADVLRDKKEVEVAKVTDRFDKKQRQLQVKLEKAYAKIDKEKGDVKARGIDTALSVGMTIFGALFGSKKFSVSTARRTVSSARGAGRILKERGDVQRAENAAALVEEDIDILAGDLQEKLSVLADRFAPENYPTETVNITPRHSDIYDLYICLLWEPVLDVPPVD